MAIEPNTGPFVPEPETTDDGSCAIGNIFAGRYKIRERLGQGGMGVVYVADQVEPVQRRVALKIIKSGVDSHRLLARFEQERQALALMDHPNIAKVLDAGVAGATPYFVMELIKGVPFTKYCDDCRLTPRQRLELFIPVCQAVQHAHQKGIIHRDLKPSNVLIGLYDGTPVPKVIDFGVAKATGPKLTEDSVYTEVGTLVGTLEYMAPEQAELNNLDIDTRADIYALGVMLYELLTGTVPFSRQELKAAGLAEMLHILKDVEPPRPSTRLSSSENLPGVAAVRQTEPRQLTRLVRGELDWIVMKALEKDRGRRYETANGFARDLERYLADEPVVAGPPSAGYRLRKFVKRNRPQVVAGLVVLVALVGGVAGTTWGLVRAEQSRSDAETQRDKAVAAERLAAERLVEVEAEQRQTEKQKAAAEASSKQAMAEKQTATAVRDFLQHKLLGQADVRSQADALIHAGGFATAAARNPTIRELLDRAADELTPEKIEANFPGQPLLQAEILKTVGYTYRGVGEYAQAVALLQRAAALYQRHLGPDDLATLATLNNLGWAYRNAGKLPEATRLLEQVRDATEKKLGPDHPDTLRTLGNLAGAYQAAGKLPEAIRLLEEVRDAREKKLGPNDPETQTTLNNLAVAYQAAGKLPEAVRLFEQVRDAFEKKLGPDHPETLTVLNNLAAAYKKVAGKLPEAIRLLETVRSIQEKKLGPDYPQTLNTLDNLAGAYQDAGKLPEAIRLFEQVRDAKEKKLGTEHPDTLTTLNNLAVAYQAAGKLPEAIRLFEQVRDAKEKKLGPDHPQTLNTLGNLAGAYQDAGKLPEAIRLFEQVHDVLGKKLGPDHPDTLTTLNKLASAYQRAGKLPEAIRLFEQVRDAREKELGPDHPDTLTTLNNLATAYHAAGKLTEAIRLHELVRDATEKKLGPDHPHTLIALNNLATAYWWSKQLDRSIPLFEELLKRQEAKLGRAHPSTLMTIGNLGVNCRDAGRLAEAIPLLEEAYHNGKPHPNLSWVGNELAGAYSKAGKTAEATALVQDQLAAARLQLKPNSPQLAGLLANSGKQLFDCKQYAAAEPILREWLALREKLPEQHQVARWQAASVKSLLGGALLGQKKYADAESLLRAGYDALKKDEQALPPRARDYLADSLQRLVELYEATGKKDEAARWWKELEAVKTAAKSAPKR
jgi:serine/threonine protein kinase/DNA-binding SARP family transcriptional activator